MKRLTVPLIIWNKMNKSQKEILLIAQEECAEVTQAISKVFRFGMNERYEDA